MEVQMLVSESCWILLIEGHVDLMDALEAFENEGFDPDVYSEPHHAYMRYAPVPDGEFVDDWREVCKKDAVGAEPVTISARDW